MSLNGIAHLPTKSERQEAKLALAAQKRANDPNPLRSERAVLDITMLPTIYAPGDNDTRHVIDNPNDGGLIEGRPWTYSTITLDNLLLDEDGNTLLTENGNNLTI